MVGMIKRSGKAGRYTDEEMERIRVKNPAHYKNIMYQRAVNERLKRERESGESGDPDMAARREIMGTVRLADREGVLPRTDHWKRRMRWLRARLDALWTSAEIDHAEEAEVLADVRALMNEPLRPPPVDLPRFPFNKGTRSRPAGRD